MYPESLLHGAMYSGHPPLTRILNSTNTKSLTFWCWAQTLKSAYEVLIEFLKYPIHLQWMKAACNSLRPRSQIFSGNNNHTGPSLGCGVLRMRSRAYSFLSAARYSSCCLCERSAMVDWWPRRLPGQKHTRRYQAAPHNSKRAIYWRDAFNL